MARCWQAVRKSQPYTYAQYVHLSTWRAVDHLHGRSAGVEVIHVDRAAHRRVIRAIHHQRVEAKGKVEFGCGRLIQGAIRPAALDIDRSDHFLPTNMVKATEGKLP